MKGTAWVALGVGGAGSVAGTGLVINHIYGNKQTANLSPVVSIRDHIAKKKGSNFKFISEAQEAKEALKSKYEKGKENKPSNNGVEITKEQIVSWCESSMNIKFSREEDSVYSSMNAWCFVNVNTLAEQAKQNHKKKIEGANGEAEGWKVAWNTYKTKKDESKLVITVSDSSKLNTTSDRNEGGRELYAWCEAQKDKKMYAIDADDINNRYEKWCFQQ